MPHTTACYGFELLVARLVARLAPDLGPAEGLLIELSPLGAVVRVERALEPSEAQARLRALEAEGRSYLFHDSLGDGLEHRWLSWHRLSADTVARLLGERLTPDALRPVPWLARGRDAPPLPAFPETWGVMF